jgi:hypothetical protein
MKNMKFTPVSSVAAIATQIDIPRPEQITSVRHRPLSISHLSFILLASIGRQRSNSQRQVVVAGAANAASVW